MNEYGPGQPSRNGFSKRTKRMELVAWPAAADSKIVQESV